jgi:predicted RNA-binding Zn-ribbon protein involved in translation (DUF1610 family)
MTTTEIEVDFKKYCTNCGKELEAEAVFCPKCGKKQGETKANARKRIPKLLFPIAGIAVIIGIVLIIALVVVPSVKYDKATELLDSGDYAGAATAFQKMGDYKDSAQKTTEAYQSLVESGEFQKAWHLLPTLEFDDFIEKQSDLADKWINSLLSEAKYQEAYNLCDEIALVDATERQRAIVAENAIALCSALYYPMLKDPTSFVMRNVWFDVADSGEGYDWIEKMLCNIGGANSYGGMVSSYCTFTHSGSEFDFYASVSDLEPEEIQSWDDSSDILEKQLYNQERAYMRGLINGETASENDMVDIDRINQLFEDGLLKDVKAIDIKQSV